MDAIRIATNCLESGLDDIQMLRSVGYVLLSTKVNEGTNMAVHVFDKVQELEPSEPQSYLDPSLAGTCFLRKERIPMLPWSMIFYPMLRKDSHMC